MPQGFISLPDVYRVITKKHSSTNPATTWVNTYDLKLFPGDPFTAMNELLDNIKTAEQNSMNPDVFLDEAVVYKWEVGPNPDGIQPPVYVRVYGISANNFGLHGGVWAGGDEVDGQICLFVRKVRVSGPRDGKLYLRGAVREGDVKALGAGGPTTLSINTVASDTIRGVVAANFQGAFNGHYLAPTAGVPQIGVVHTHKVGGFIVSATFGAISTALCDGIRTLDKHRN